MLPMRKILCPTDFSEPSYRALHKAIEMAWPGDVEFVLLHVLSPSDEQRREAVSAEAQRYLDELIRDFIPRHIKVRAVVRQGDVTNEILRVAEAEKVDMIVMATHGATGWREIVLGSVSDEVIRLALCPVVTIGAAARSQAAHSQSPRKAIEPAEIPPSLATRDAIPLADTAPDAPPRMVDEADFPLDGSPATKLRFMLNYAILAPSNRNTQPWKWRFAGDTVELYADRSRALPHLDPDDRELTLSCGAALLHLRVAIRHFGFADRVEILPSPDDNDLLACVSLREELPASAEEELLFEGIPHRHTNRQPFLERELPDTLKSALQHQAATEGAWLLFIEDDEARMAIINLIAKSDRVQGQDPLFLQETASWIRPSRSAFADGIPAYAFGHGGLLAHYTSNLGEALADKDRMLAWSAPALAVLQTSDDTPRAWLAAGQALARVLLRASAEGVQASFLNSPVEVADMWPQLHQILQQAGLPQLILRLGYPTQETSPTPRRMVSEVATG